MLPFASLRSLSPDHLLRLRPLALAAALALALLAGAAPPAFADPVYDADGTVLAPTEGMEAAGFSPDRASTASAERGNANPNDSVLRLAPSEFFMMGSTHSPDGDANGIGTYQIPSMDASRIPSSNIAYTKLEGIDDVRNDPEVRKMMVRNPGAVAPIDINGDGIDEIAQVYYACDRDTGKNAQLHHSVFNEYGEVFVQGGPDVPLTPGSDVYNNYPVQSWSSIFVLCVGDFDGNGNEDMCFSRLDKDGSIMIDFHRYFYDESGDLSSDWHYLSMPTSRDPEAHAYQPLCLKASDIDGDGRDEVLYTYMNTFDNTCEIGIMSFEEDASGNLHLSRRPCAVTGVALDSASMLSVSPGDIDADGQEEVVLGGYSQGELFLGYLEYDRENETLLPDVRALTRLYDDDDTHRTTGADLNDHHYADTSQYWSDPDSDYIAPGGRSLATYVNATNWTIPLQTVSLTGIEGAGPLPHARDQVFFGMLFYELDQAAGAFRMFGDATSPITGNDDNNISVLSMQPVVVDDMVNARDVDAVTSYDGKELLLVMVSRDMDEDHGEDLAYEAYLYRYDEGSYYTSFELARPDYYDRTLYPKACALNCDDDAIYLKLREHQFVYSEPILSGVIMAPPTFADLYALTGYNSGSTAYTETNSTVTETGGSSSLQVGGSFKLGTKRTKVGPTFAGSYQGEWSDITTKEYWYTLATSGGQDSAAIHCIPADVYLYDTYTYDMWTRTFNKGDPMVMTFPCEPLTQIVPLDDPDSDHDYAQLSRRYNDWAAQQNQGKAEKDCYRLLPEISEFLNHTAGDPTTYVERVDGLLKDVYEGNSRLAVDHSLGFGNTYQSTTVIVSEGDSKQYGGTFHAGVQIEHEGWLEDSNVEVSIADGGFWGETTTDGAIFEGVVNSISNDFPDYYYTALMYAGWKVPADSTEDDPEDDDRAYAIIDYTTSDVRCPPAAARDVSAQAAGPYAVTVSCTLPWDVPGSWRAQRYRLECYDEVAKAWKPVEGSEVSDPGTNAPQQWSFTHDGLDPAKRYWYRMVSERSDGGAQKRNVSPEASALTEPAPLWQVTYSAPEHARVWAYRVDERGSCFSFESGAQVPERSTIRFACIPEAGYGASGWTVTDGAGASLPSGSYKVDGGLLIIDSLASTVHAEPQVSAVPAPAAASGGQDGAGDPAAAAPFAAGEPVAAAAPASAAAGAPTLAELGVAVDYPHDGVWTTDEKARVLLDFLEGTRASSFAYVHRKLHEGAVLGAEQPGDVLVDDLQNGAYAFPIVVGDGSGAQAVRELSVLKDAGLIALDPSLLESYDVKTHEKRALLLFGAYPGASGLASFEMAPGADAQDGWQDVSAHLADGYLPMESGTWTLRLTNVAGQTMTSTIEVPVYPKAGRPDPVVPGGPDVPGGSDGPQGEGTDPGASTRPAGGSGDGSALAPAGDASAMWASVASAIALAAVATLALALRRRRRRL